MMLRKIIFVILYLASLAHVDAQELKATVIVNAEQVTGENRIDKNLLNDMQSAITNFVNNYKWTDHTYQALEKIKCTFVINITDFTPGGIRYKANVQVASTRPVYNTTYETQVFNYLDKEWEFDYAPSSNINYSENSYVNALSSLISFYVYMILSYDYDSFAKAGGTVYLEKAQQIMNSAQSTSDPGWKSSDSPQSRYWIMENLINPQQQVLREVLYRYYRQGLDKFSESPDKSREVVLKCLEDLKQMSLLRPNTLTVKWFFNTKDNELVSMFSKASPEMKQKVYDLLRELDPTNVDKYNTIMKSN